MPASTPTPYAQTNIQLYEQSIRLGGDTHRVARLAAAWELAIRLFSRRFRSSGKPFLAHLVGTASILLRHGAGDDVITAGLLHAAYAQGDFGDGLSGVSDARRHRVASSVGASVEAIVHAYGVFPWETLDEAGTARAVAAASDVERDVLFARAANALEDICDGNARYSSLRNAAAIRADLPRARAVAAALGRTALADELSAAAVSIARVDAGDQAGMREGFSFVVEDG